MTGYGPDGSDVVVRTEGNVVVVAIPETAEIDGIAGRRINREYMETIQQKEVTAALTLLESPETVDSGAFSELERAAAAGVALGITRWAVVVDESSEADAFADHVVGIKTRFFDTKERAMEWLAND